MNRQNEVKYTEGKPNNNSWTSEVYTRRPGETREGFVPAATSVWQRKKVVDFVGGIDAPVKPNEKVDLSMIFE